MPDPSHKARHRAGRQEASRRQATARPQGTSRHQAPGRRRATSKRQATSKPGRLIAGLALPTAATVALMFGAAGAAVATSAKTQSAGFGLTTTSTRSPQPTTPSAEARARQTRQTEATTAVEAEAVQQNLATIRASAVARGVERKKVVDEAKHEAFAHSWQLPITNPVTTSGFGYRWGRLHAGEDFAVSVGTPLASMSTGTVTFAGEESGFGVLCEIRYWDGTISYFGHMSAVSVNVGDAVEPGQIVGRSGNTGHSTGPHLHLEIHPDGGEAVDPLPWLADHHIAT